MATYSLSPSRNKRIIFQVPKIQSSHAILVLNGNYVLQLRDDKPTIAVAGQWALFGGRIKNGETPLQSIKREVYEELFIIPHSYKKLFFKDYYAHFEKTIIRTWFFEADVSEVWGKHKLNEGQAARAFQFSEIADLKMPDIVRNVIKCHYNDTKKTIK